MNEDTFQVCVMGKPSTKHALKRTLRHLGRDFRRKTVNTAIDVNNAIVEALELSKLKDFDKKHGTNLYGKAKANKEAQLVSSMCTQYKHFGL